jgi:hypothetical protein
MPLVRVQRNADGSPSSPAALPTTTEPSGVAAVACENAPVPMSFAPGSLPRPTVPVASIHTMPSVMISSKSSPIMTVDVPTRTEASNGATRTVRKTALLSAAARSRCSSVGSIQ